MKGWKKGALGAVFLAAAIGAGGCATTAPDTVYRQQPNTGVYDRGPIDMPADSTMTGRQPVIIHPDGTVEALEGKGTIKYGGGSTRERREGALDQAHDNMRDINRTVRETERTVDRVDRFLKTIQEFGK